MKLGGEIIMNRIKAAVLTAIATLTVFAAASGAAAEELDLKIRLDGVLNADSQYINFDKFRPIQIDSRTFVPARAFAEAAGMTVEWDQSTQTALLTLNADAYSQKPIERYGAEIISKISGYGLDLEPLNITAALKLYDKNAIIRYNFADSDGDVIAIGKTIEMTNEAQLVDDAALMIPLRNAMELFGLDISWEQETLTAGVSIPVNAVVPSGLSIVANHTPVNNPEQNFSPQVPGLSIGKYIGKFKITKYCPCNICNGGWGMHTAWAGEIIPGQTVSVDPSVIGKLSWIYIDGYGLRRAEDCGGAVNGYHIDVAVATHEEATTGLVVFKDVYLAE